MLRLTTFGVLMDKSAAGGFAKSRDQQQFSARGAIVSHANHGLPLLDNAH
jgi:hypothetical protein